jgi:hypothetical protein
MTDTNIPDFVEAAIYVAYDGNYAGQSVATVQKICVATGRGGVCFGGAAWQNDGIEPMLVLGATAEICRSS